MILVYAPDATLGSLTRVRAAAHTLRWNAVTVLTDAPWGKDPRVMGDMTPRGIGAGSGPAARRAALDAAITELSPDRLVVDVFPTGPRRALAGWTPPEDLAVDLLVCRLRTDAIADVFTGRRFTFDRAYACEAMDPPQAQAVRRAARRLKPLVLRDPRVEPDRDAALQLRALRRRGPVWLILHAGPEAEVQTLLERASRDAKAAREAPSLVLVHPAPPSAISPGLTHLTGLPAWPLLLLADRVYAGAGFNTVRQLLTAGVDHRLLPFPRRFDDQEARARSVQE